MLAIIKKSARGTSPVFIRCDSSG